MLARNFYNIIFGITLFTAPSFAQSESISQKKITLSCNVSSEDSVSIKRSEAIAKEAFKRMKIDLTFQYLPAARATLLSNSGKIDGELVRVFDYGKSGVAPNLIRTTEPLITIKYVAFIKNPKLNIKDLKGLKNSKLQVDILRGLPILKRLVELQIPKENLTEVNSRDQEIQRLLLGRSDLFLDSETDVQVLLKSPKYKNHQILKAWTLGNYPLYIYLHKKNENLIPQLDQVLRKMKTDGTIDQIEKNY